MDDVYVRAQARTRIPAVNLLLFLATVVSTLWTGFVFAVGQGVAPGAPAAGMAGALLSVARDGLPFAGALVGILFTHEMGHYLLARRHRVDTTLPFFIPFLPYPYGIGTLGAVIRIRSVMPSRRAVLDIGVAGPLAGFALAVPLLIWGYAHSPVAAVQPPPAPLPSALNLVREWLGQLPAQAGDGGVTFGRSLVTVLALRLTHPGLPPGTEVTEHPVAIAAWFGLYVTTINLLPIGQLDGGHLLYALLGRERARTVSRVVSWALLAFGLAVSWTWVAWWALTRVLVGNRHPPAVEEEPLGRGRTLIAILGLLVFAVTFTPVPMH